MSDKWIIDASPAALDHVLTASLHGEGIAGLFGTALTVSFGESYV